MSQME